MRRTRLVLQILAIFGLLSFFAACSPEKDSAIKAKFVTDKSGRQELQFSIDIGPTITRGNYSYIPINRDGHPSYMNGLILELLKKFEDTNPHLEILESPRIDKDFASSWGGPDTHRYNGIWIHHRPQQK